MGQAKATIIKLELQSSFRFVLDLDLAFTDHGPVQILEFFYVQKTSLNLHDQPNYPLILREDWADLLSGT